MIRRVYALYFSPSGSVGRTVRAMAMAAAKELSVPFECIDLTLPKARQRTYAFGPGELVFLGTPTYAGRVPNKLAPWLAASVLGAGALGVSAVCFGNRSFDDALIELWRMMQDQGFQMCGAAAVAARHAFTDALAPGRPDEQDMQAVRAFACQAARKAADGGPFEPLAVPGQDPPTAYYTPLGADGQPARFLKAKPETDMARCTGCGLCAAICPMGSIPAERPGETEGICIKCHACVRMCPRGARRFTDPAFLSHRQMLTEHYTRPAENLFLV